MGGGSIPQSPKVIGEWIHRVVSGDTEKTHARRLVHDEKVHLRPFPGGVFRNTRPAEVLPSMIIPEKCAPESRGM